MIRTKIVCTIGPASRKPEVLRELVAAGMDVARLNFSHSDYEFHRENIHRIRAAAEALGSPVAIMADLQGPKLRVGEMAGEGVLLREGELVLLTDREEEGRRLENPEEGLTAILPIHYEHLRTDAKPGAHILIDDGLIELVVTEVREEGVVCRVITGGLVKSRKGLNLPGIPLTVPAITEKDQADLAFALDQDVDWVALSFVRKADEVIQLKELIRTLCPDKPYCARVIAKIEKPEALDHIDEIIAAADGIMVARGDLGIEIPAERVPLVQKRLIRTANAWGKPVITATQMLDSMVRNPRPTRAEASDVANAILDGTDATMLSGETAVGKYPVKAVQTMVRIAEEVERVSGHGKWQPPRHITHAPDDITEAVSHATCDLAYDLQAAAIITATASGRTARAVASYRPPTPIIAVTPHQHVQRQLMLSWGIIPLHSERAENTDQIVQQCIRLTAGTGLIKKGDRVVLTAGVAANLPGSTNLIRVEVV
ncbi:MAG TPA: pyruvate kinase [Chloroflexi bacterium]|nr:pyruvate kinase [Chloroflexota bacterium]